MASYFLRRLAMAIPVMFFVALFVFLLLRLTPGDPAQAIAGDQATPAQLAAIRENLGLDKPIAGQFVATAVPVESWMRRFDVSAPVTSKLSTDNPTPSLMSLAVNPAEASNAVPSNIKVAS